MARRAFGAVFTGLFYKFLSLFDSGPRITEGSIYDFTLPSLDGKPVPFEQYKGKYLLIVNTASHCGFTPQFESLEKLHELYGNKVAVLGFPANNFLWQEPGSSQDIAQFCQKNYGVRFQMFEKVSVKGRDRSSLFKWLESRTGKSPSWNFCKYLVDPQGRTVSYFPSRVDPLDPQILDLVK